MPNLIQHLNRRTQHIDSGSTLDWGWLSLRDDKAIDKDTAQAIKRHTRSGGAFLKAAKDTRNQIMLGSKGGQTAWINTIDLTMTTTAFWELADYIIEGEENK